MTFQPILPTRFLGKNLSVSALGYGAMGLSEFYGETDPGIIDEILMAVLSEGVTLIDTADVYGRGHNEEIIGKALKAAPKEERAAMRIATKCGIDRPKDEAYARRINNDPAYIRACCDASLSRLGVERIDLFYIHRVDPDADIAATMEVLSELQKAGKIAGVGLCEVSAATLQRAHEVSPVTAIQSEYSLWTRDVEEEILPLTQKLGIGFVAYSPLGRGFLTGRYKSMDSLSVGDFRLSNARFSGDNLDRNTALLAKVEAFASRHNASTGQVALAWLLAQAENIVPIPGTRSPERLRENIASASLNLSRKELATLSDIWKPGATAGERYSAEGMKGINA